MNKYCPLCNAILKSQSIKDSCGYIPVNWCINNPIMFQGGKQKFHFEDDPELLKITMIVMPYRIVTYYSESKDSLYSKSVISIHIPPDHPDANADFKSGKHLFKTILKLPPIPPMPYDKLLQKIKTLVVFS